jgi:hypothetical protein
MATIPENDRDKLIKILRMFGSNHDGEVASAARRAHDLVKSRALDWDDIIIQVNQAHARYSSPPPPPPYEPEPDEEDLIHECAEHGEHLTAWERNFIQDIAESIIEWGQLTSKQRVVLDRIVSKLKLRGVWT